MSEKKPEPVGFVWTEGRYSAAYCSLNGVPVGSVNYGSKRDDPLPYKSRMVLGGDREFEKATREEAKQIVEIAARIRIKRLLAGLELAK